MKRNLLLSLPSLPLLLFLNSCDLLNKDVSGLILDKDDLEISLETSIVLNVSLQPEGAKGEVVWSSDDPTVASVDNGMVTAIKRGSAGITASCGTYSDTCRVSVIPVEFDADKLPSSLKGESYHIIQLDDSSYAYIEDRVVNDFRPDNLNKNLWIWESTFLGGASSGLNYYGLEKGWISLVVANKGWSGAGFNVGPGYGSIDMTDLFNNPLDYYFHISLKSSQPGTSVMLIFKDKNSEAKVVLGSIPLDGIAPYSDFARDNMWSTVEVPVSYLNSLGVFFNDTFTDVNILSFLAGGIEGTTLDLDAMFFYKKPE